MNKRLITLLFVVILIMVSIVGCGNNDNAVNDASNQSSEHAQDGNTTQEISETTEQQAAPNSNIDKSLSGLDLLNSISPAFPSSMYMETTTTMADGSVMNTVTYNLDTSTRTETVGGYVEGTSIMIYNDDEGATYQYIDGESTGTVMYDDDLDMDDMDDMDMDMSPPTLADLAMGENVIARIEQLNGEDVIYIETTESEEGYEVTVKMWFSIDYAIPLKMDMDMNGQNMNSMVVTKVEYNNNIDASMFTPPADVEFTEFALPW